uniref:uncharacterized protein LOC120327212 isoform X1 n=1 Tax=Styela clava TaxID=7725 RepID=UPI00193A00F8|nr:uncharacterized protein LOC120327212 isoform X1 [Styela clava]
MDSEDSSRIDDFEAGEKALCDKDFDVAIEKFQGCMKKLSNQGLGLTSELFPKCLQNIASCYSEKGDMDNALSFKKFEKLYYETVLLHNGLDGLLMKDPSESDEQSTRDRGDGSSEASGSSIQDSTSEINDESDWESSDAKSPNTKRASEYEQLAKLCLQQECIGLALEYSGKATLLYMHEYGDDHQKTRKSFEQFTSVYAEAGKLEYSESMEQLNLGNKSNISSPYEIEETLLRHRKNVKSTEKSGGARPLKRTRSILKKRASDDNMTQQNSETTAPEQQRRVTFADPLPQMVRLRDEGETDNSMTNLLLFFLVCVLIILISLLISAVFCQMNPTMGACVEFRREVTYYYNRIRYLYRSFIR